MKILTESTPLALWHGVVKEAQTECQIHLKADVEAYLVMMLIRYTAQQGLAREAMAAKFLQGMAFPPEQRGLILQGVGDQCLLITGLFPGSASRRQLNLRYFVELGQAAYDLISRRNNDIFSLLSLQFTSLMDILQSFRPCTMNNLPLELRLLCGQSLNLKQLPPANKK